MTSCLFLIGGLVVSLEPLIIRYFTEPVPTNDDKNYNEHKLSENKANGECVIMDSSETGSLLTDDDIQDGFTSPRISRTYTPYDAGPLVIIEPALSPAPTANKDEL